jgi:hypothetical protein
MAVSTLTTTLLAAGGVVAGSLVTGTIQALTRRGDRKADTQRREADERTLDRRRQEDAERADKKEARAARRNDYADLLRFAADTKRRLADLLWYVRMYKDRGNDWDAQRAREGTDSFRDFLDAETPDAHTRVVTSASDEVPASYEEFAKNARGFKLTAQMYLHVLHGAGETPPAPSLERLVSRAESTMQALNNFIAVLRREMI